MYIIPSTSVYLPPATCARPEKRCVSAIYIYMYIAILLYICISSRPPRFTYHQAACARPKKRGVLSIYTNMYVDILVYICISFRPPRVKGVSPNPAQLRALAPESGLTSPRKAVRFYLYIYVCLVHTVYTHIYLVLYMYIYHPVHLSLPTTSHVRAPRKAVRLIRELMCLVSTVYLYHGGRRANA